MRYRRVAGRFTDRVQRGPGRDVGAPGALRGMGRPRRGRVTSSSGSLPSSLAAGGPTLPEGPSVEDDPAGAWTTMNAGIQALLDDPAASAMDRATRRPAPTAR